MNNSLLFQGNKVRVFNQSGSVLRDNHLFAEAEAKLENEREIIEKRLQGKKKDLKIWKILRLIMIGIAGVNLSVLIMLVALTCNLFAISMTFLAFLLWALDFSLVYDSKKKVNAQVSYLNDRLENIKGKQEVIRKRKCRPVSLDNKLVDLNKYNEDLRLGLNRRLELLSLIANARRKYEKLNRNGQLSQELYEDYSQEDINFAKRVLTNRKYR